MMVPCITAVSWLAGKSLSVAALRPRWSEPPPRLGRMDRASALALFVARGLLRDDDTAEEREGFGVVLGTELGCAEVNDQFHRGMLERGVAQASPMLFAQTIP